VAVKIKERKGKWWVYIDYKGKRKAKCVGDKRAATTVAQKIEAKLALGDFGVVTEKEARPFKPYFRAWLDSYVRANCKESTYVGYEIAFRLYLAPAFGEKDISKITREEVKQLSYRLQGAGKSRSTIKGTIAPLCEMFNHAVEDGHVTANPALRILRRTRSEHGERREKVAFLSHEELARVLTACERDFPEHYPFVLTLARTGMRIGEAAGLQWADLDLHQRLAEVRRTVSKGRVTTPKSGKARRVDLSAQLAETLRVLLVERKKETLRRGRKEVPPWVFVNEAGNSIDTDNFRARIWPKLFAKAGVRQVRIHDLRHSYASFLIAQGESLAYIRDQMGHHSIRVTVDTYGHLVPSGNKAAVDRLDAAHDATIRNLSATSTAVAESSEC
jgi:integrase